MAITVSVLENMKFGIKCRGHEIVVDQPTDEGGSNAGMTPVELLGASLASCIMYYTVEFCNRHHITASGLRVELDSVTVENPHRIGTFDVKIHFPSPLNNRDRKILLRLARSCTVHNTFEHPPIINVVIRSWELAEL